MIIAVIWGLSILGVNTSSVLAGVGIISLILGFGAQSLIEDIITGFFIIFEGQYGSLSDKHETKLGKRMPFILCGTAAAVILMRNSPIDRDRS